MPGNEINVTTDLTISYDEIVWRFSASGGPGGQHANTSNTRVEALFSIDESSSLTEAQKLLLHTKYGAMLRIVVTEERSQLRNREIAVNRLAERLRSGLVVPKRRAKTRPTRGSIERRLEGKRNLSRKKQERSRSDDD